MYERVYEGHRACGRRGVWGYSVALSDTASSVLGRRVFSRTEVKFHLENERKFDNLFLSRSLSRVEGATGTDGGWEGEKKVAVLFSFVIIEFILKRVFFISSNFGARGRVCSSRIANAVRFCLR